MNYEEVYSEALNQVKTVKDFATEGGLVTVCGKCFIINAVSGYPRTCTILGYRDGWPSPLIIGLAMVQKCRTVDEVREIVARKIAKEIVEGKTVRRPEKKPNIGKSWYAEIMKNSANFYSVKMVVNGQPVSGLPELVRYRDLKDEIYWKTGIEILPEKELIYAVKEPGKRYAYIDVTQERKDCRVTEEEIKAGWKPAPFQGGAK